MRKEERDRIKARRDGLVARIAELTDTLANFDLYEHDNIRYKESPFYKKVQDVLNRQPRQSLDLLKAEVLEEWADTFYFAHKHSEEMVTTGAIADSMKSEAERLRNKAEEPSG